MERFSVIRGFENPMAKSEVMFKVFLLVHPTVNGGTKSECPERNQPVSLATAAATF
jgi:hypothetical protein